MAGLNFPILIILGVLPSILWLVFFLRKDTHPEPNRLILLVFFLGAVVTIPTAVAENWFSSLLEFLPLSPELSRLVFLFFGIALAEELAKYGVVRFTAMRTREVDEPIDLPLYMIVSALGFAALENVLALFGLNGIASSSQVAILSGFRFVGAVFLHAATSGSFGYFLAVGKFQKRHGKKLFALGLFAAVTLHGFFNLTIMREGNGVQLLWPLAIVLTLALFISLALNSLTKTYTHR
ncbi:MAG: PrsW family intramembrane metalloprotease [bacterium]|nr:PrsW family intramembrane metalloprotease [bacterium]